MALTSSAGNVIFQFGNEDRQGTSPFLQFPGCHPDTEFSFSFWAKPNTRRIPSPIVAYYGANGSYIYFYWDGDQWVLEIRVNAITVLFQPFFAGNPSGDEATKIWRPFCFVKDATSVKLYSTADPPTADDVIFPMTEIFNFPNDPTSQPFLDFDFFRFSVVVAPHVSLCNIKVWNVALPDTTNMANQLNEWDNTIAPLPIWSCPFRTGDVVNIAPAYRKTSQYWYREHIWSSIDNIQNLAFDSNDPTYLRHQPTPTWVYPLNYPNPTMLAYDLDKTPLIPTTYRSPDFFRLRDQGTIPLDGTLTKTIAYLGFPTNDGTGVPQDTNWALFKDQDGNIIDPAGDPQYQFDPDTLSVTPATLNCGNLYQWSFGVSFTWQTQPTQVDAAKAMLTYPFIFVTYVGMPTGVGNPPFDDLVGLFAITKGALVDTYYRGTELKIPDPTIRTALIGE